MKEGLETPSQGKQDHYISKVLLITTVLCPGK